MKKLLSVAVVSLLAVGMAMSATIQWSSTANGSSGIAGPTGVTPVAGVLGTGWVLGMYLSPNGTLPTAIMNDGLGTAVFSGGGGGTGVALAITPIDALLGSAPNQFGFFTDSSKSDAGLGLVKGVSRVVTVAFNAPTVAAATKYAVVDDAAFLIPDYAPTTVAFPYVAGATAQGNSPSGDWKDIVPEPATMTLLGLGVLTLAIRRKIG